MQKISINVQEPYYSFIINGQKLLNVYYKFYTKEQENEFGVLAIKIKNLK